MACLTVRPMRIAVQATMVRSVERIDGVQTIIIVSGTGHMYNIILSI